MSLTARSSTDFMSPKSSSSSIQPTAPWNVVRARRENLRDSWLMSRPKNRLLNLETRSKMCCTWSRFSSR